MSERPSQRQRTYPDAESGILNERILFLVFETLKWDIRDLCRTASVNQKLRAIAKRLLWRELCAYRAPRMVSALMGGVPNGSICGGWQPIAKLMFFCCGCESTRHFRLSQPLPGHFVSESRFSKTSGRSFLSKKCRGDVLYLSDQCEHPCAGREYDLGIYRGIFWGFKKSRTREYLINSGVGFEERIRCPYCGNRVWSMNAARLVPKKSAARRLGSLDDGLEYFVCLNGHLHGTCLLVPLSSDEADDDDSDDGLDDRTVTNGSI